MVQSKHSRQTSRAGRWRARTSPLNCTVPYLKPLANRGIVAQRVGPLLQLSPGGKKCVQLRVVVCLCGCRCLHKPPTLHLKLQTRRAREERRKVRFQTGTCGINVSGEKVIADGCAEIRRERRVS